MILKQNKNSNDFLNILRDFIGKFILGFSSFCCLIKFSSPSFKAFLYDLLLEPDLQYSDDIRRLTEENEILKMKEKLPNLSDNTLSDDSIFTKVSNSFKYFFNSYQQADNTTKGFVIVGGVCLLTLLVCYGTNSDLNSLTKTVTQYFMDTNSGTTDQTVNTIAANVEQTKTIIEALNNQNTSLTDVVRKLWSQNQRIINILSNQFIKGSNPNKSNTTFTEIVEWSQDNNE